MTAFAGCDFDTKAVHVVLLPEEGLAEYHRFELEGMDAFERTRDIRDKIPSRGWWDDQGVVALGIEEPMGRGSVLSKLNTVQGAILSCLPRDLLVNPMRPSVWRVSVDLPGNASKDAVRLWVHDHLGTNPYWPQDACDAFCLAVAVQSLTVPA